jgi:hypothetical protein
MSIKDFFVKEKPVFTGITRGLGGFGFGASGGGAAAVSGASVKQYNVDNSLQSTTFVPVNTFNAGYTFTTSGYYTLEFDGPESDEVNCTGWCWGAGGGRGNTPGPGFGGGGNGVRGNFTFNGGDTLTVMVGEGGKSPGNSYPCGSPHSSSTPGAPYLAGNAGFPDGGCATYNAGGGGGSSRIAKVLIPYPTRNDAPNTYMLIGAAGGGGIGYTDSGGTIDGRGGYPSGYDGGGYYPQDGGVYGRGASQSGGGAGGPAGRMPAGNAGSKYLGGNSGPTGGGAGGGGYYGGGGAGGYYATGGGGSGYIHPSCTSTASFDGPSSTRSQASDDPANPGTLSIPAYSRGDDKSTPQGSGDANPIATANSNGFIKIKFN